MFGIGDAVNGRCGGAPVVGFDGLQAVGVLDKALAGTPDLSDPTDTARPTSRVMRVDAVLADASRILKRQLTVLPSGTTGTTRS